MEWSLSELAPQAQYTQPDGQSVMCAEQCDPALAPRASKDSSRWMARMPKANIITRETSTQVLRRGSNGGFLSRKIENALSFNGD
jgi:hypothetical protein